MIHGKLYNKKTSIPKITAKLNIETNPDLSGQQLELREQDKRLGLRDEQGRALYYGQRYTDDEPVNATFRAAFVKDTRDVLPIMICSVFVPYQLCHFDAGVGREVLSYP